MIDNREWRSPQLVRDLKPHRPGFPELVTKVGRNEAIALLIGKLHSELYEIEMEPRSAEEIADLLTVLDALFDILKPTWTGETSCDRELLWLEAPSAAFITAWETASSARIDPCDAGYGIIHHQIERFARNLIAREDMYAIISALARAAVANNVSCVDVVGEYAHKWTKVGGFDGHLLWQSTEF